MSKTKGSKRPSRGAATALREIPANTAWLLHKAIRPLPTEEAGQRLTDLGARVSEATHSAAETASTSIRETGRMVGSAGKGLATTVSNGSGHDLSDLMRRADSASERARSLEVEAVQLAQLAKNDAETATTISAETSSGLNAARTEAAEMVQARVDHAREQAKHRVTELIEIQQDELEKLDIEERQRVERVRVSEESAAGSALDKIEREATNRVRQAQKQAEQRHEQAARTIAEADEALAIAQELAEAAASAAQEAAAQATREAEQLATEAKDRTKVAKRRTADAERSRARAKQPRSKQAAATASSGRGQSNGTLTGDALETLAKTDLLRVAQELDVVSPTSMKKSELVKTLAKEGVVPDQLTKRELISLGETRSLDVRSSMSKAELVRVVASHINS